MDKHFDEKVRQEAEEKVPKMMVITKRILEVHGYTQGCQGCRALAEVTLPTRVRTMPKFLL